MSSFIVTGAAGLIGSNIIAALNARGETDIIAVDHLNHPAKQANLDRLRFSRYLDRDDFRTEINAGSISPVNGLFHLGACSATTETNQAYLQDNNVNYTRELCQWSLANNVRFVYASSAATYGNGDLGYNDSDEFTPSLTPLNLYGQSKQDFDIWALNSGALKQIAGLKYFNVFGPGEDHKGAMRSVIHKAFHQILETNRFGLFKSDHPDYGDGEQERDFVDVRDAAAVSLWFYDNPHVSGLFNCGTGNARSWLDLLRAIFSAMDRQPSIDFVDMPAALKGKYQHHTCADLTKLRAAGCDHHFNSIETAVDHYVRNYLIPNASSQS